METVDKLRDWARHVKDNPHLGTLTDLGVLGLDAIAHGIEREVAERYMELPVDADGVPIRVGDVIGSDYETPSKVTGMECVWSVEDEPGWNLYWGNVMHYGSEDTDWGVFPDRPSTYRHAKPRTVEDVLLDAGVSVAAVSDVAAEIRELLEVD